MITDDPNYPLNATKNGNLSSVQSLLSEKLKDKSLNLGAPIIGADVKGIPVSMVSDSSSATNTEINPLPTTIPGETPTPTPPPRPVVIVNETNNIIEITSSESSGSQQATVIAVAVSILVIAAIGTAIGFYCYKRAKQSVIDQQSVPQSIPNHSVNDDSSKQQVPSGGFANQSMMEVYEPQYHPKPDIGSIFGWEDPIKKQNDADDVIEDDDDVSGTASPQRNHDLRLSTNGEQFNTMTPDQNQQDNTPLHEAEKIDLKNAFQNTGKFGGLALKNKGNTGKQGDGSTSPIVLTNAGAASNMKMIEGEEGNA
ncbi:hypothetical protein FGO68_gene16090 [Halteria grandinella]|uniref:Uncharacterized protein n=1 Tax=Halteria grandinella TaxID=5974 RepID=A0A8J8ND45_HALGN|nr:hypothetical protein FGO68_gene16090 [Halteria grandinella]